ncbi:hypothetical protein RRG08_033154 [Elysia crispata]|uniref:Uncharacterized protein n=1 Tax=Elysia crispata TaxID=231223 RepID=A0AAE1D675_9GAST|nr:hypothetical protein RRG08_033154 [Elysia crispata]
MADNTQVAVSIPEVRQSVFKICRFVPPFIESLYEQTEVSECDRRKRNWRLNKMNNTSLSEERGSAPSTEQTKACHKGRWSYLTSLYRKLVTKANGLQSA